ncbi:MAG TPA: YidC/Oxa1 family membrane protein insertase, partial [Dehalococcoidia bacterium]
GCMVPMLIQFPIWIALYRAIVLLVGTSPENLVSLSQRLYPWSYIQHGVPVDSTFLWLNLGEPNIVLPFLVAASMFVQTKTSTARTASANPQQQSMNNMMLYTMPLIFGWFSLTVPSGLALYWFATNLIGIGMNYLVFGKESFRLRELFSLSPAPAAGSGERGKRPREKRERGASGDARQEEAGDGTAGAETVELGGKKRATHGKPRSHRKNRR